MNLVVLQLEKLLPKKSTHTTPGLQEEHGFKAMTPTVARVLTGNRAAMAGIPPMAHSHYQNSVRMGEPSRAVRFNACFALQILIQVELRS
jgi:hypothetical protein